MKISKPILLITYIILTTMILSSCRVKDCRGRKKTAKTAMGAWL